MRTRKAKTAYLLMSFLLLIFLFASILLIPFVGFIGIILFITLCISIISLISMQSRKMFFASNTIIFICAYINSIFGANGFNIYSCFLMFWFLLFLLMLPLTHTASKTNNIKFDILLFFASLSPCVVLTVSNL